MEAPVKVPKPVLARFQEHIDLLIPKCLFLVGLDVVPRRVYRKPGSTAIKGDIYIAFTFSEGPDYTCDYFLDARGYTEHRRYFVNTDEVELLENYEGRFGASDFIDDDLPYEEHMRIMKHNNAIRKLLVKKGFVKK